jgi:GntR family transcriptional regulator
MEILPLNHQSAVPLHAQLSAAIEARVAAGGWRAGEMIASERDLMRLAGVSRATVRQAIGSLIAKGVLRRVRGRGTLVARPRIEQPLQAVYSFAQQLERQGLALTDRVLQRRVVAGTPELASQLGVTAGEPVVHIQRVRSLEGAPFALDHFFIPDRLVPGLLDADLGGSLYRLLAERYDLPVLRAADTLEPAAADRTAALHLGVPPGAPLMVIERVGYTRGDLPLHAARTIVRGDMCRFRIALWADEGSAIELKPLTQQAEQL